MWDKVILWNDRIIDQRGPGLSYDLKTGREIKQLHPITGKAIPWQFTKTGHHCNYAIASPHMVTFRAGSAGFLDLESCTTSRLDGFRSGCRNSLIPAGGVLNAPNFAHGCVCSYSLFTSLAFVHVPEADLWTYNALPDPKAMTKQVGINLGAPGDRQSASGTMWLDYPSVGGPSPKIGVKVAGSPHYFRRHSKEVAGELPWVGASGATGLEGIRIDLGADTTATYKIRLCFVEPTHETAGQRIFAVSLNEEEVLPAVDIFKQAGGKNRTLFREFDVVNKGRFLTVAFKAVKGQPLCCGVEVIAKE